MKNDKNERYFCFGNIGLLNWLKILLLKLLGKKEK